jgi:RND family efflux transporter MFP subunit
MRSFKGAFPALVIAAALGCGEKKVEQHPEQRAPVVIQGTTVASVAAQAIPDIQEAVGTVRARNSAVIAARIAGSVSGVHVREGERVAKGALLVTIEAAESTAQAAGALSGADEARQALDEARSRKKLAEATFDRYRNLYEQQAVTRQEFEERRMEQEVARDGVARGEARLKQAQQAAKAAGAVAGYGKVKSPISGVVLAKQVEAGQTVFPGAPLMTVEGDEGFRLEVAAPERLLGKVKQGDQIGVQVEGAQERGRVSEIVPSVDPASRTFIVKIDLPTGTIRSGAYGKAYLEAGSRQGITIPVSAVVVRGALTSVWVVREGIARLRLVKLGREMGGKVEVISGLSNGERIVIAGANRVTDGAKVE